MADGARLYQILRGRLYERLPLLALALGLLDWREGEKTGTDGRFFYAPISFLEQAVRSPEGAEKTLLHSVLHAMLLHPWQRGGVDAQAWSLACDMKRRQRRFTRSERERRFPLRRSARS